MWPAPSPARKPAAASPPAFQTRETASLWPSNTRTRGPALRRRRLHQALDVGRRHRLRDQPSLHAIAVELAQALELLGPLDPLRHDREPERARHLHDRGDDRRIFLVAAEP